MGSLGGMEIAGIVALFVLLFGAKKLPDLGSSVGKSIKNFKKGVAEAQDDDPAETSERSEKSSTTPDAG